MMSAALYNDVCGAALTFFGVRDKLSHYLTAGETADSMLKEKKERSAHEEAFCHFGPASEYC